MRQLLTLTVVLLMVLAGCTTGGAPADGGAAAETPAGSDPGAPDGEPADGGSTAAPAPLLDAEDAAFRSAADAALAGAAAEPGTGAIYLEVVNSAGTAYYGTYNHTELTLAEVNANGMLVFNNDVTAPHTFGIHDPFTTGPRACVDGVEDESTSGYDVFGFSQRGAPNTLKPFDDALCSFEVTEENGVYTGVGTARAHFYTYTDGYHERDMRFVFVYRA
ncbi:hypothetical protein [Haloglomus litoreum]|uniref:hypothetical protein n=1 Tax=Haloglomus litoreum TaxID=3034026 RepID=UPI0023E7CB53|nr:hypothetical protein [Haloglomus sp. DT116]